MMEAMSCFLGGNVSPSFVCEFVGEWEYCTRLGV